VLTDRELETAIRARHAAVHQLRAAGTGLPAAAAALGLTVQTASRFWRAESADTLLPAPRGRSALDPYQTYLRRRWAQGTTKIQALHQEITARGYRGSYTTVHAFITPLKLAAPPAPPAPPTPRQATGLITGDPARLTETGLGQLTAIRRCPELDALAGHVTGFAKLLTGRHEDQLGPWITAVDADPGQPELHSFTNGIRHDEQPVRNALTLPWSSGLVEGLNTRTKLLMRQMYGHAGLPLLRKRILITS
jgi:hypothetical protein